MNNFLQLIDIVDIIETNEYVNMVDIGVDIDNSFMLSNGIISHNSASGAFRKHRVPEIMAAFALRGKFANVSDMTNYKLSLNKEVVNLMSVIGLRLGHKADINSLRFGKILLYVDADFDGNSIAALLLNFFHKYWPELFDMGLIYKVETPILVAKNTKNKKAVKELFYNQKEYEDWVVDKNLSHYEIKYKKGLGALVDDEYKQIINEPKLTHIVADDISALSLDIWFGDNPELRKKELLR